MEGLDESVCKSNAKKKNREDDGELEDFLFGSALGAEDVSASAKGRAQTRPLCLQEDGRDEQERKNDLSDVQDEFEIHNMRLLQRVVDYQDHHKMSTVCYTFPCMDVSMNEDEIHRKRNWVATVATFLVLGLLSVFVWRVLFFTGLIRSGGIDLSNFSFLSSYSASAALASAPLKDGTFDVATTDDPSLGTPGAPVTIVEFADFQCPFSKQESSVLRELAARYPQQIYFIYRDFPLSDIHPLAQTAAEAGACANAQGKFWEYHDRLYQNQSSITQTSFVEFARELNLDVGAFETCLMSDRMGEEVLADYKAGVEAGVRGTPTFFINGNRIAGAIPKEILETIIASVVDAK